MIYVCVYDVFVNTIQWYYNQLIKSITLPLEDSLESLFCEGGYLQRVESANDPRGVDPCYGLKTSPPQLGVDQICSKCYQIVSKCGSIFCQNCWSTCWVSIVYLRLKPQKILDDDPYDPIGQVWCWSFNKISPIIILSYVGWCFIMTPNKGHGWNVGG